MPLNLSFTHIVVVLVVALVVLGPERLPDAARSMGKWINEFRRMSHGLQAEVRDTFGEYAEPFSDLVHTVRGGAAEVASTIGSVVPQAPVPNGAVEARVVPPPATLPELPSGPPRQGSAVPTLPSLPALGPGTPVAGTFSPGPPASGPVFAPLGTPEPGAFTPRP